MNDYRWFNQTQPQTLQIAVLLCYFSAVSGLIFGVPNIGILSVLAIIVGLAAGGFGIANEKKWGYAVAVSAAVIQVLMYIVLFGFETLSNFGLLISFMFDAALLALLVHPMSRDYQRIWFR
ncbi:MAG: hypothetical protein SGJ13_09040 [Actinomycetota bacterium]|nr:hypothetical protein [Actinomycetota bacterium]